MRADFPLHELDPAASRRAARAAALEASIASLASHIHAANYRLIAMLREFEDLGGWFGWPSPAHWLQWRCGYSLGTAREKFRVARALPELPLIRAAFKRGELSFAQVRAMTRVAKPENEATVLMWAQHSTASHMEKLARLYRRYGENAAVLKQHRERSLSHWEDDDGMVTIRVRLPADQAAVVIKAIDAARASLDEPDEEAVADDDDHDHDVSAETRPARMADAFLRVAEAYLEPDGRPRSLAEKYQVHVHLDLRRDSDGRVLDPDAPSLAAETVRRLGCEAGLVPVLHEGGYGLSVGDDSALVFTRPGGERIPEVPQRPVVEGSPVTRLCFEHRRLGISAETHRCHWDGQPADYGAMIEGLQITRGSEFIPRLPTGRA